MATIGVGIIGAGGIAKGHASAYNALADVKLVAVADVDMERARAAAAAWGCEACTVDELMEQPHIQAVSICTPPNSHKELSLQAFANGKHVLVEKPIALDLAEADDMIAAANKAGRLLMVGHTHRYWPNNVRAKELLDAGEIGDLIMVSDDILADNRVKDGQIPWRLQKAISGGGVVMDNGVHSLDRLRWWVDSPVQAVYGRMSTDIDPIDVENNARAIVHFANKVDGQMRLSFTTPSGAGRCRTEFLGTKGFLTVDTWGAVTLLRHGQGAEQIDVTEKRPGLLLEIEDFIDSIRHGTEPRATAQDGRAALEMVLAVYRSSERNQAVELPLKY